MKKGFKLSLLFASLLFISISAMAQDPGPDPGGDPDAPIDGGGILPLQHLLLAL